MIEDEETRLTGMLDIGMRTAAYEPMSVGVVKVWCRIRAEIPTRGADFKDREGS